MGFNAAPAKGAVHVGLNTGLEKVLQAIGWSGWEK
jgi:hypothetical protein